MFRNIAGSIGIAVVTAIGAERLQAHRAYLAGHLTPFDQPYQELLARHYAGAAGAGPDAGRRARRGDGPDQPDARQQAAVLSYADLYIYSAVAAFCIVPLTLLFRSGVAGRPG